VRNASIGNRNPYSFGRCLNSSPDAKFARRSNRWRQSPDRFERRVTRIVLTRLFPSKADVFTVASELQIPPAAVQNILLRKLKNLP
jgi:hypothetical protein